MFECLGEAEQTVLKHRGTDQAKLCGKSDDFSDWALKKHGTEKLRKEETVRRTGCLTERSRTGYKKKNGQK